MNKLYTVGYGGRPPKQLVTLLTEAGIKSVADIRLRPDRARIGAYVRAKSPDKGIRKLLNDACIEYASLIELGNVFLECEHWQERYSALMTQSGELLTGRLTALPRPFCLMCAERDPSDCHRSQVAAYLATRGWRTQHLN